MALKTFQALNNALYSEISELIKTKYKAITPTIIHFIAVAQLFFSKSGNLFAKVASIKDKALEASKLRYSQHNKEELKQDENEPNDE